MIPKFIIFHQPKTAGTYAYNTLPNGYVLKHNNNYHWCLKNNKISKETKLACIVRNPLDYYISLITFWCLDPRHCRDIKKNSLSILKEKYENNKMNKKGHVNYWISNGFTERNLENILKNLFNNDFINKHKEKLSKKHHTYDNYVFLNMSRLDIGYYTFAFLDQNSRKKVSDIKTTEECREEIIYIYKNFITLNTKTISEELKELCKKYSVKYENKTNRPRVSNRKTFENYNISDELIKKIRYKDRYMFEIFKLDLY